MPDLFAACKARTSLREERKNPITSPLYMTFSVPLPYVVSCRQWAHASVYSGTWLWQSLEICISHTRPRNCHYLKHLSWQSSKLVTSPLIIVCGIIHINKELWILWFRFLEIILIVQLLLFPWHFYCPFNLFLMYFLINSLEAVGRHKPRRNRLFKGFLILFCLGALMCYISKYCWHTLKKK